MSVVFYTPNGDSISALRSRIQAAGVALLFTYSVNFICQAIAAILLKDEVRKNKTLTKILQTSRVLYLYAVAIIFSVYPPFFQGIHSAILAWVTFLFVLLMHIFSFFDKKIKQRSLWAYTYTLFHICLVVWFLLIMGFGYTWMSQQ